MSHIASWRSPARWAKGYAFVAALAAAACSGDDHPPLPPDESIPSAGGARGSGGASSVLDGGGAGVPDSGSTHDASAAGGARAAADASSLDGGGAPLDAGCEHPMPGSLPSKGQFVCSTAAKWSDGSVIQTASTSSDDVFSAITPDELTIVWMSITDGAPLLHYADRLGTADPFAPFGSLSLKSDYYAAERAAVSPDGARIVVLRKDRKGFGEFVRQGRGYSFDPTPTEASFGALDNQGLILETDEFFGDPVISSDDRTLYYSKYGAGETTTIFASTRSAPVSWPLGAPVDGAPLLDDCGARRRPTGVSADGLTLFYFDESSGTERATWRSGLGEAFTGFVDLGARAEAQPNAECTALYFSAGAGASGGDNLFATTK